MMDPFGDDKYAKLRQQGYGVPGAECISRSQRAVSGRAALAACSVLAAGLVAAIVLGMGPFADNEPIHQIAGARAPHEGTGGACAEGAAAARAILSSMASEPSIDSKRATELCELDEETRSRRARCAMDCLSGAVDPRVAELEDSIIKLFGALRSSSGRRFRRNELPESAQHIIERKYGPEDAVAEAVPDAVAARAAREGAAEAAPEVAGNDADDTGDGARSEPVQRGAPQGVDPAVEDAGVPDADAEANGGAASEGDEAMIPRTRRAAEKKAAAEVDGHPHLRRPHPRAARGVVVGGRGQGPAVAGAATTVRRRHAVREAMRHAWSGYRDYAWGRDSLKPVSRAADAEFVGMALTAVDAMDTLLLMGLEDEFAEARDLVASRVRPGQQSGINLFETTIRVVGGLLAVAHLRSDGELLRTAAAVADAMSFAFETQTGLPFGTLDLATRRKSNPAWSQHASTVSEVASLQMEWQTLSRETGNATYAALVDRVMRHLRALAPGDGLYPMFVSPATGKFASSTVTLGARADSLYEYLLKQWLLDRAGQTQQLAQTMYAESMEGVRARLLAVTQHSRLAYIAERRGTQREDKMDHLVCFVPGMLLLGAHDWRRAPGERAVRRDGTEEGPSGGGDDGDDDDRDAARAVAPQVAAAHRRLAQQLARTCYEMYRRYPTGLAPELVHLRYGGEYTEPESAADAADAELDEGEWRRGNRSHDLDFDCKGASHNLLRPETVESLFYLWRFTRDPMYREWGWRIFRAFEQHARVPSGGYSSIKDVRQVPVVWRDHMESFWLGETLKYLYLLFSDDDLLPLDKYVLNTEAHPLPMVGTTAEDAARVLDAARRAAREAEEAGASPGGPGSVA